MTKDLYDRLKVILLITAILILGGMIGIKCFSLIPEQLFNIVFFFLVYQTTREWISSSYRHIVLCLGGLLYLIVSLSSFFFLYHYYSGKILFHLIMVCIIGDTFSYLVGSWIGGPKICPQISPSKTWSGFFAGTGFSFVYAYDHLFFLHQPMLSKGLVLFLVAMPPLGDFLESWAKRKLKIKDTGYILGAHGGLLDRIDSWLLIVLVYGLLTFIPRLHSLLDHGIYEKIFKKQTEIIS